MWVEGVVARSVVVVVVVVVVVGVGVVRFDMGDQATL